AAVGDRPALVAAGRRWKAEPRALHPAQAGALRTARRAQRQSKRDSVVAARRFAQVRADGCSTQPQYRPLCRTQTCDSRLGGEGSLVELRWHRRTDEISL